MTTNRSLNKSHLNRLIASIKSNNLLSINPIIVDKDFKVLDGQHRLAAAKQLKLDVSYIVYSKGSVDDVILLNTAQKNWSMMDFAYSFFQQGKAQYKYIIDLQTKYGISVTAILNALTPFSENVDRLSRDSPAKAFKHGLLQITEEQYKQAKSVLDDVQKLSEVTNNSRCKWLIQAVARAKFNKEFNTEVLLEKAIKHKVIIEKQGSIRGYLRNFEDILNTKKRLSESKVCLYDPQNSTNGA